MWDDDGDSDSDSDHLYIDEGEPSSSKRQKTSENQNPSMEHFFSKSNTKPSELLNVHHITELPHVNNNKILNSTEEKPRITINNVACISDDSNTNDNDDFDILALLAENKLSIKQHTYISVHNEVVRADDQNNDPRLRKATAATDYQRSLRSHMSTPQAQRVPIPQNPFGVKNKNIQHTLSAPSMNANRQAGDMVPYAVNHSEGAIFYGPPTSTQRHNRVNANVTTPMTHAWPFQNGHQPQIYTDAFNTQNSYNSALTEYNEQAANYYQRATPPMNRSPGWNCGHQKNYPAYHSTANPTPQDQSVPMPQNASGVQNKIIPHMPSAPSMNAYRQAGAMVPYTGKHSEGAMSYGPSPSTQGHNGVNANFTTAMNNDWPVQNGHQPQIYTDAFNTQNSNNFALAEYNEQAPYDCQMNCPVGYYCRHMLAYPSNPQPTRNSKILPNMYPSEQRPAATNSQLNSVSITYCQNFSFNGHGQAWSSNFIPNNGLNGDLNAWAFAEMQQAKFPGMQLRRAEVNKYVASTWSHVYEGSPYNNVMGSGVGLKIPNWNASSPKETISRKRAANPNTNTLKANASLVVKNQVAPSKIGIQTRNNIDIPIVNLISACTEPSINNTPNLKEPPFNTDANLTTMRSYKPKANIDVAQASTSKDGSLQPTAMRINNDGAQTFMVEAPQGEVNKNMNRDSSPLIIDKLANLSLNINKAPIKTTMLNTAPKLAAMGETKKDKIDDQARANAKHALDVSKTQSDNNNDSTREKNNRSKESTEVRMQTKHVTPNTVSTEAAISTNLATQDRNPNASRDSQDNKENVDKHRNTPRGNDDQSANNATRVTEDVINNSRNTLKKNCISKDEELPQVKIPGRKQKGQITKEKKNKSKACKLFAQKNEYICSKCSVHFSYPTSCLNHMRKDHDIENPELIQRISWLCPYCGSYFVDELYNNHIQTAHKEDFKRKY